MGKRILILQGHPDPAGGHFGHALAEAYAAGAREAGHELREVVIARLPIGFVHTREDWESGTPDPAIAEAQAEIARAQHIVLIFPLWLGTMPALTKAFLEQALRPGFAIRQGDRMTLRPGLLGGRSVRVVVTMGMPAFVYRWFFGAHSLKSLERNILRFVGLGPIRESIVGMVEGAADKRRAWLDRMRALGAKAI